MDGFTTRRVSCALGISLFALSTQSFATGYFQLHNLMSQAQKNIPNNLVLNDSRLNLENQMQGTGHVVNTQFANNGGMAGCGVSSTLVQYIYQKANVDLSKNYIALNVFSQVMGYDPKAPYWGDPEGSIKGYLTQGANIAYPYTPYHRILPSIYPAYLGMYNNGLNCGRWIKASFDTQFCLDRTTTSGKSKSCPVVGGLTYQGQQMQGYVFDSCEDNNGWCRDDAAHIDVNGGAFTIPNNYYVQWQFITNPYYSDANAPAWLKDVWFAWFSNASQYWSYVAILNAQNGISNVEYNIGNPNNPTWIGSHVLGGNNDLTWSSTSNNGQLWQVEPVNALTDSAPSSNPTYQMRMFDYLGYPSNNGAIYQFQLLFSDGTLGQAVSGYYFFYQGGLPVKSGSQAQNMTIFRAPKGPGSVTVAFGNLLPDVVSLDPTQSNYLRPVLITDSGYAYDATKCTANQCTFANVPTSSTFTVFAHAIQDVSNDLTLRKTNDVAINSAKITFPSGATSVSYNLTAADINLSTLYSARVQIPLAFATSSLTPINANLQALFVPDATANAAKNISAQVQGCFLNTYVQSVADLKLKKGSFNGNNSICTVYYTVNNQTSFATTAIPPAATFTVLVSSQVGVPPVNYGLTMPYSATVNVTGYNPIGSPNPETFTVPMVNYQTSTSASRSFYLILDPNSDAVCLQNLDPTAGVSVNVGSASYRLTQAGVPLETQLSQAGATVSAIATMKSGAKVKCQAMSALVNPLNLGVDTVDVIKLELVPVSAPPKPLTQGVLATATGDINCLGGADTLTFTSGGSVAAAVGYTVAATATKVGVNASAGTYTITDKAFQVVGGTCQLSSSPSVTLSANTFTPVTLNYSFTATPGATCSATAQVLGSWPNGCTVQVSLSSAAPLSNVTLAWPVGNYNWSNVVIFGGEGSLNIPSGTVGNVTWPLPGWVNGQGSSVGFNVNNDGSPSICAALANSSIKMGCSGISTSSHRKFKK